MSQDAASGAPAIAPQDDPGAALSGADVAAHTLTASGRRHRVNAREHRA
jgi:hypothetical protein